MDFSLSTFLRAILSGRSSFAANVLTLMSGAVLAQGLTIAAAPILTRLYLPEDFGVLALFVSLSGMLSAIAGGRYEMAIMLPREDKDAANILALACLLTVGMAVLTLEVVALWGASVAVVLRAPVLGQWLWWIPLSIFLTGVYQALIYWNNRKKQFRCLAVSTSGQAAGSVMLQMGAGIWGPAGPGGLIAGNLGGQLFGVAILSRPAHPANPNFQWQWLSLKNMKHQGRLYWRFPVLDSWATVANLGAHQLPPLLLNFFFGPATAGFYSLGYRVLNLPLQLINASLGQVFFQRYEEKRKTVGKGEFLWTTLKNLALVSLLPSLVLFLSAPFLFGVIFGPPWMEAGEYVRMLTPLLFFRFIASSTSTVFLSEGKNFWLMVWQLVFLVVTVLSFVLGGLFNNIYFSIISYSFTGSLLYLHLAYMEIKISRGGEASAVQL